MSAPRPTPWPDNRLNQAALILAVRYYKYPQAAFGVAGGFDVGSVYIGRIDDYWNLIKGFRGEPVDPVTPWPTIDEVKAELNVTGVLYDDAITQALDAAIAQVVNDCEEAFGVG